MDVAALSVSMHQAQVKQTASISVLKMAMETANNNMESMTDALKSVTVKAVHPNLGHHLDITA